MVSAIKDPHTRVEEGPRPPLWQMRVCENDTEIEDLEILPSKGVPQPHPYGTKI